MEFDHWESIGRREYEVSLRNRVYADVKKSNLNNNGPSDDESFKDDENHSNSKSSPGPSQNFRLRLTDSLLTEDSPEKDRVVKYNKKSNEKLRKSDVIVISDSSDDDDLSSLYLKKRNHADRNVSSRKNSTNKKSISLDTTDEEDYDDDGTSSWIQSRTPKKLKDQKRISLLTSDESLTGTGKITSPRTPVRNPLKEKKKQLEATNSSSSGGRRKNINNSSSTDASPSPKRSPLRSLKTVGPSKEIAEEKKVLKTPNPLKLSECTTPLSIRDIVNIKKTIDSRRVVFDSPANWNKNTVIDETESESDESESNFNRRKNIGHPALINETLSDQESIDNHEKSTHDTSTPEDNAPKQPPICLSESKKNQISDWLMNAPDDPRSDDSLLSVVPPSTCSPAGSGNSSLERLEVNYETPNNRDRFRKNFNHIESPVTRPSPRTPVPPGKKNYSPLSVIKPKTVATTKETKRTTDINNYDDILEKLYGNNWKEMIVKKATPLNDKNLNVNVRSRGVQTEPRKKFIGDTVKKAISISSDDDDDDNLTPRRNVKIKKKPVTVVRKPVKDSFINDDSVDSGGDTTYLTALTTPRKSDENEAKKDPVKSTTTTRRAIEICDSDTDDDWNKIINNNDFRSKKRLSYSDDDNTSTGTSEYDPLDVVLPRRIFKTTTATTTPKISAQKTATKWPTSFDKRPLKTKSFLTSLAASVPMEDTHPEAKKYKLDFKNTKEELSKKLYKLYNENVFDNRLPKDMSIEWNVRMRGTAGYCYNRKTTRTIGGVTRSSRIVLSSKILDSADRLRDTLIHEMCHAASWLLNEVCDGHGPFWKAWANKAVKRFPELPEIKRCHDYKISTKFTYRCVSCGYSIGRHSKSLDIDKKRCGHCLGKFELLINRVTKSGTNIQTPKQRKEPTGFALYVKENYGTVKKKRHGVAHKEIMQILGQQFSDIKIGKTKK